VDSYFITRAPVRGFETLVRGKSPVFVTEAAMRICGICHAAHGIASAEAIEDAIGVAPPANGRLLREVIGLLNRVQSHLLHLVLVVPDIVREQFASSLVLDVIKLLNMVNDVMARIGGAPTHPPNIVVGGISRAPSEAGLKEVVRKVKEILKGYSRIKDVVLDEDRWSGKAFALSKVSVNVERLATHPFYGDRFNIDVNDVVTLRYPKFREGGLPEVVRATTSLVALYRGRAVEVGPRARLDIYRGLVGSTLMDLQRARVEEVSLALTRITELLGRVSTSSSTRTSGLFFRRGAGVGVFEAPRGVLIHRVEVGDEGRVKGYKVVVPTMFNIPVVEAAAKGAPVSIADLVPRVFDPCVPCSTHLIEVGEWGPR